MKEHKRNKKLKITVSVIAGVIVLGFLVYKASFNVLAPVVFDFVVGKNPEALLNLGGETTALPSSTDVSEENESSKIETTNGNKPDENKNSSENDNTTSKDDTSKNPKGYSTETYIGTLTTSDMAAVIKNISASDKTRIISICKSVVSASDMPRFAKMAKSGMSGDDYAFAESYLRSRLSPAQKKEIMEIVRKYLGR